MGLVVMTAGVVLPAIRPGITSIMLSALLLGGTFTVITMADSRRRVRAVGCG